MNNFMERIGGLFFEDNRAEAIEGELAAIEERIKVDQAYLDNVGAYSENRDTRVAQDFDAGVQSIVEATLENLWQLEERKKALQAELESLKAAA